ncbi:MAG: hypothetical protein BWY85_01355 [Firmicutes bacterium ADurb.Bin506]|nr:MAG: hypothetical protein BWY85_01355 [Firmicutes bacterium ADurb.Bin506]
MVTAGSTTMNRFCVSTSSILFMRSIDMTMPPNIGTHPADRPVPDPRGVTGTRSLFASFRISDTSVALAGFTTTSGMRK